MPDPESKSILTDVKEYLGSVEASTPFDSMLLLDIESEISKLIQLGVIEASAFTSSITAETKWSDVLPDEYRLSMAKTYVKLGVKLVFDPPTSSSLLDALKREKDECEWRAKVASETP